MSLVSKADLLSRVNFPKKLRTEISSSDLIEAFHGFQVKRAHPCQCIFTIRMKHLSFSKCH